MNDELLHFFLYFPVKMETLEVSCRASISFRQLLESLAVVPDCSHLVKKKKVAVIVERNSGNILDIDVSLYSLNVRNGLTFYVYLEV